MTTFGDWAFSGCQSLKFFTFGSKVKTIGQVAFSDCTAVTEISSRAITPPICGNQALDDINKAIEMEPREPLYHVEKAALTIRVNLLDECIQSCQTAIALNPNIIDAYRILGYAQLQKGDKKNAQINLQKAIDMGDESAKKIIETYF